MDLIERRPHPWVQEVFDRDAFPPPDIMRHEPLTQQILT